MRIDSALNRRAVGLASLVARGEQNVSYGHLGLHVALICPELSGQRICG
jgi:hypothetical protein